MKRPALAALIALNLALLGSLALVTFSPGNQAQASNASSSSRGEYVAVSGNIAGSKTPMLWVVNQSTQEIIAVQFDAQRDQLIGYGYRNMNNDSVIVQRNRQ